MAVYEIELQKRDRDAADRGRGAPYSALLSRHGARGDDGHDAQVQEMRCQQRGQGVVHVTTRLVGDAECAVCDDARAELEIEKAGFKGCDPCAEEGVELCEWAESGETSEEDVGGDLQAGGGECENVLRGEGREGFEEEAEASDEEDEEGAGDSGGDGADGDVVDGGRCAHGAVVCHGFGEEHWAEEEEEGLDAVLLSVGCL